ncbi:MAG: SMP-30/gluconolactonase/LRE family protein [Oricola sp.]|nr:MAG: SMP-30/gluconolactonase/LRE family protein [Oricola sp.]
MAAIDFLSRTHCHLGEGPFFCDRRDTLFWFDIVEKKRYAHDFATGTETVLDLPEMASAMGVAADGRDVIFTETGLLLWDGTDLTRCAAIEADNPQTRSNDARIHPSGAFWLGTMGKGAEPGSGAIYRWFAGSVDLLFDNITIPNAICFSPDGTTAWFTDTPTGKLMRVATDPATGAPTGEPQLFFDHSGGTGGLDGAICDGDGSIWNARWGASALDRYAPDGTRTTTIDLPVTQPSCPAFVGGNRLAVTSAWENMDAAARTADPDAGATLIVTLDVDIEPRFEPALHL